MEHAGNELRADRAIVLEAVARNGFALRAAAVELTWDREALGGVASVVAPCL